jgi:hypothetical protein
VLSQLFRNNAGNLEQTLIDLPYFIQIHATKIEINEKLLIVE